MISSIKTNIFIFLLFLIFNTTQSSATNHFKITSMKMEIFRNNKLIGYSNYYFEYINNKMIVKNNTKFEATIFGIKKFSFISDSIEKYENNKLVHFNSKTLQNNKKKYVTLSFDENNNNFSIEGSSFKGFSNIDIVVANWWNNKILKAKKQISPISGSIKDQNVTFVKTEKINLYNSNYSTNRFKLKSKNKDLSKNKELDFDIWVNKENNIILKVSYSRFGNWEYRLKSLELN
tara:strand:- start:66 stop:764 length:699 start_codon:yes stop_codon:yes gene_type:complete